MRLFSYCIPIDDGAAPNPFGGICTLAICKPVIRRVAEEGDWIIGIGGSDVLGSNLFSGKLVYAMKVTWKVSMKEYDQLSRSNYPEKIPLTNSKDSWRLRGDSIYDFDLLDNGQPTVRQGVHTKENLPHDLSGKNVLISDNFYYFGKNAIEIPLELKIVVRQGQGHQSNKNESIKNTFIEWLEGRGHLINVILGEPQLFDADLPDKGARSCGSYRCGESLIDEYLESTLC